MLIFPLLKEDALLGIIQYDTEKGLWLSRQAKIDSSDYKSKAVWFFLKKILKILKLG
jgi:hypothetical protein